MKGLAETAGSIWVQHPRKNEVIVCTAWCHAGGQRPWVARSAQPNFPCCRADEGTCRDSRERRQKRGRFIRDLRLLGLQFIRFSICFCITNHILDIFVTQTSTRLNDNTLFLSSALVFCTNIQNTICINIKRYFNLRYTSWGRWNSNQVKLSQHFIIGSHLAFSL